jgi:formylglycine-generating enzyme required for sulfatase activity
VQFSDHPVTGVTYEDARAFCNWLTRKEEKTYRLPTEAEWEYACRAGTTTRYYWGDKPSPTYLNYLDSAINGTVPVGSYPPNAWKLHDMLGNASQWCLDWFGKHAAKPQTDPWGPTAGEARVLRGGWFRSRGEETTCGSRIGMRPDAAVPWAGFRVVMIPPERPAAAEGGK